MDDPVDDLDEEEELGTYLTHAERLDLQRKINVLRAAVLDSISHAQRETEPQDEG